MFRSLRRILESIVFAGMRPAGTPAQPRPTGFLGRIAERVERLLSGTAPDDPLYLTHRTPAHKLRLALVLAIPFFAVSALMYFALSRGSEPAALPAKVELTPAELASKLLPEIGNIKVETNRDIEVLDAHVEPGTPPAIAGTIRNNANRLIRGIELVFDLTDERGSRLGGVTTRINALQPGARTTFRFSIPQHNAAFALVREIRTL
jgi:hypothetical protein